MPRIIVNFWLFMTAATLTGGLLGRYLAALAKGVAGATALALVPVLAATFLFSVTVLIRIVRASNHHPRQARATPPERTHLP